MGYEDQALTCTDCGETFVFAAQEQERFAERGFQPPKRCRACRKAKRGRRRSSRGGSGPGRRSQGEYRSPAFHDSEPQPQRRPRHARGGSGSGRGRRGHGEYRSPAFRDLDRRGQGLYRSPAFREQAANHDDEYRSPAFRDQTFSAAGEYRAPGFQESKAAGSGRHPKAEHPLFKLVCAECGAEEMVPFLPDELEHPLCDACYDTAHGVAGPAASDPGDDDG